MGNIDTPDSIGALPRSRTELIPGAKNLSVYQGATRADVPEPPSVNSYTQLGEALSRFAGSTGVQLSQKEVTDTQDNEAALGHEAANRAAMDKSIKDINDAVRAGELPEGASPTAQLAFKANFLKLRGEQGAMSMREAYYNNQDLRNSDDPNAYHEWASKYMSEYLHGTVNNADGDPQYSSLEMAKSNIHGIITNAARGLQSEHMAYRVSEREKMYEQTAGTLATTRLESMLGTGDMLIPHEYRNYQALADAISDVYYNPSTGQAALGGMDRSKVAEAMRTTILDKAMAEGDINLLSIARYIKTPGGTLADSKGWKDKATAAIEHIAGQTYLKEKRELEIGLQRAHGPIDQQIQEEAEKYNRTKNAEVKKNYIDALESKIYGYDPSNLTPKMAQERAEVMAQLKAVDPKSAVDLDLALAKIKEQKFDYAHKRSFSIEEAKLMDVVAKAPGTPSTNKTLFQALTDERIDGPAYLRLRNKSDQDGNDERDPRIKKLLSSRDYTMLEESVGKGVAKDLSKISGQESIAAGLAMSEYRGIARDYLKKNQNATAADLNVYMTPLLEKTALKYNEVARDEYEAAQTTKKNQEQFLERLHKMQEDTAKEVESLRKMPPVPPGPSKLQPAPAKSSIDVTNFNQAKSEMKLTDQEQNIYRHHLKNLNGTGKVMNSDGSVSTVYQGTFEHDGKYYNLPTVWDGKKLSSDEAWAKAQSIGLDKFPAYKTEAEAEARYQKMHAFMERDTAAFLKKNKK